MTRKTMTRQQVFNLIEGERSYQDALWNPNTTTSDGNHSWEEWFMYIDHYIDKAKEVLSTQKKQDADPEAANIMRKVAALATAAMENNGSVPRVVPAPKVVLEG
jgi:hypothetical protein